VSLSIGTKLGSVEVLGIIGRGGMGEVYRARDTKLKRDVAIKTLPDEFSHDPDRLNRFQREAEVLASLNHPNIAAIYDLQEAAGSRFLVLELVEGETLADRIARGPIPIDEALVISPRPRQRSFDLHPDGERIAAAVPTSQPEQRLDKVTFIINFFDELRRIAPLAKK
jgi:serine/threonine-protein kinase